MNATFDGFMISGKDVTSGSIFCHDCMEEITDVESHFRKNPCVEELFSPLNQQFEDHIDHDVAIVLKVSFYNFKSLFELFNSLGEEETERIIN